jgi:Raf kinase inhibitor-like YbhB/YbcL family protein
MLENLPESIGHALINQRAGMENVVYNLLHRERHTHPTQSPPQQRVPMQRLQLLSPAFAFNARLPSRFTADGEGISPPLTWDAVPAEADSLALIVEDADAPTPHPLVHAIVVDLPAKDGSLEEGALTSEHHHGVGLALGRNSFLKHAWLPPDPPRGHGEHRYVFQLFALSAGPLLSQFCGRGEFIEAVLERAIAVGCLIGTYERSPKVIEDEDEVDGVMEQAGAVAV